MHSWVAVVVQKLAIVFSPLLHVGLGGCIHMPSSTACMHTYLHVAGVHSVATEIQQQLKTGERSSEGSKEKRERAAAAAAAATDFQSLQGAKSGGVLYSRKKTDLTTTCVCALT